MRAAKSMMLVLQNFLKQNGAQNIIEIKQIMDDLSQTFNHPQSLNQFTRYLQYQCGLTPRKILNILYRFVSLPQLKQALGQSLQKQYLLFKIFQILDILRIKQKNSRYKLTLAFYQFTFHEGKTIRELLQACMQAINYQFQDQEITQIISFLHEQVEDISKLMSKQQIQPQSLGQLERQKLNDLINDLKIIPQQSFEYELQKWLIFAYVRNNPKGKTILENLKFNLPTKIEQIQSLKHAFQKYSQICEIEVKQRKDFCERINKQNEYFLYQNLCFLKNNFFPINVPQINRLINKSKLCQSTIANKDIILFIGHTGSGKTTTILKFMNYQLERKKIKGLTTLVPIGNVQQHHKTFYTSPEAQSCTRYINAVSIPNQMYPDTTKTYERNLFCCDSPGFGDSAGAQVDIANGIGMMNALINARSVRLVVIITYQSFASQRMFGTISTIEELSNFYPRYQLESIFFLFNHFPPQKIKQIPFMIKNRIESLNQNLRESTYLLFKKLINQSKKKENYIFPLNGNFKQLLHQILKMQPIYQINLFKYQFTKRTKESIQIFILSSQNHIVNYSNNNKFQHAYYHFKNLRDLKDILKQNNKLQKCYKKMSKLIQQTSRRLFDHYQQLINRIINYKQKDNHLNDQIKNTHKYLDIIHKKFSEFDDLRPNLKSINQINQIIKFKVAQIQNIFQKVIRVNPSTIICALKSFSEYFKNDQLQKNINYIFEKSFIETLANLRGQFKKVSQNLAVLTNLSIFVPQLNKQTFEIQQQIRKIKAQLTKIIKNNLYYFSQQQKQQFPLKKDISKINQLFYQIQSILSLGFIDNADQYQKQFNKVKLKIQQYCLRRIQQLSINSNIHADIESKSDVQLKELSNLVQIQIKFGRIEQVVNETQRQIKIIIKAKLQQATNLIQNVINDIKCDNAEPLHENLIVVKKANDFVKQIKYCYSQLLGGKEQQRYLQKLMSFLRILLLELIKYLQRSIQKLKDYKFQLDSLELKTTQQYYLLIFNYEQMEINLKENIQFSKILQKLKEKIQFYLDQNNLCMHIIQWKEQPNIVKQIQQILFKMKRCIEFIYSLWQQKLNNQILDKQVSESPNEDTLTTQKQCQKVKIPNQYNKKELLYQKSDQLKKNELLQQKMMITTQKIVSFIEKYFKEKTHCSFSSQLTEIFYLFQQKIKYWLKLILYDGDYKIETLKKAIQNQIKPNLLGKKSKYTLNIKQIFIIYNFIGRIIISSQKINIQKSFLIGQKKQYQQKIIQIFDIYEKKIENKPELNIKSMQIFSIQKIYQLQKFAKQIKIKGQIINEFKGYLLNNYQFEVKLEKLLKKSYFASSYKIEIQQMMNFLKNYSFFGFIKRNMTKKQLQQDINTLNKYYSFLKELQSRFGQNKLSQNLTNIVQKIKDKFNHHFSMAIQELKSTFKTLNHMDYQNFQRPNTIIKQLQIFIKSRFKYNKFILDGIDIEAKRKQILNLIKSLFQQLKNHIQSSFQHLKSNIKRIKILQQQNDQLLKKIKSNNYLKNEQELLIKKEYIQRKRQIIRKQRQIEINEMQRRDKQFTNNLTIFQKALIDFSSYTGNQAKWFNIILSKLNSWRYKECLKLIQDQDFKFGQNKMNHFFVIEDFEFVLSNISRVPTQQKGNKLERAQLQKLKILYQMFIKEFRTLQQQYYWSSKTNKLFVRELKKLGQIVKIQFNHNKKPLTKIQIQMLARIYALWSILSSKDDKQRSFISPIPAQVIALMLLIGLPHTKQIIHNRLAQVILEERNTLIIAILSCYLVLVGFNVKCACQSSYICDRDFTKFEILFKQLEIQNKIEYAPLNKLCEDVLKNSDASLEEQIKKMILAPKQGFYLKMARNFGSGLDFVLNNQIKKRQNPTILIFNQADIFFNDSFYAKTYQPVLSIEGKPVRDIFNFIWEKVQQFGDKIDPQIIISSKYFEQLVKSYPSLQTLLKNQINGLIFGALNYKHDYLIVDKQITYKDGESYNSNNYGYKTSFANIYQFKKQNVSASNLKESLKINLKVAQLSYTLLPKYFNYILGVTSTLENLSQYKRVQLQSLYKINDQYSIPSISIMNKKLIQKYKITSDTSFYQQIVRRIDEINNNRPILIFFKRTSELSQFVNCYEYQKYLKRSTIITENHEESEKKSRITKAVDAGNITLLTILPGRGTDFLIQDDRIKQDGGLHVIQTFLSLEQSEEIYIKGHTARQNSTGSYDCIINQNSLEQLGIKINQISIDAESQLIHTKLKQKRDKRNQILCQNTIKTLEDANQRHQYGIKIFQNPNLSQQDLINYIQKLNNYPKFTKAVIKTVLAIDATGSMMHALKKTCEIIRNTFQQSFEVLKVENVQANIEIKIKVYRNYNSPYYQILQETVFQKRAHNLSEFLAKVEPKGGLGNEALEVLFQSLNKCDEIDQVILIGDAAPNTPQEVKLKRSAKYGQQYWQNHGFPITNIQSQLKEFIKNHINCPVNSFYLNKGQFFKQISRKTNGHAQQFKIYSSNATEKLLQFVVENILKILQKKENLSMDLVKTYRKLYIQQGKK